ncbi:MAG: lytic transglycosylase domain-containing protein [Candidatus Xenobiia bacterium LiM19]
MKRILILVAGFIGCLILLSQVCFAGGDSGVYRSSYTDSDGNETVIITNRGAQNLNRYIRQTSNGGYIYKNYTRLSPQKVRTLEEPPAESKPCSIKAPYSQHDVSYVANSSRYLEPIVIPCPGLGSIDIAPIIIAESRRYNVDPLLLKTVIKYESGFCASAVSPAGAAGLMQLMPGTASVLGVSDVFSPHQNISGGAQYIRRQLDNFGNNVALALAAYNAGPGAVMDYGGIPPYEETQNYVNMILSDYLSQARVARKRTGKAVETTVSSSRKIDVIEALTRMKDNSSASSAQKSSSQLNTKSASSELVPVTTSAPASVNLLENRGNVQGNPLENNPTVKVPGY